MTKSMKPLALASALVLSTVALAGCNAMEGFGQDLQNLGTQIESDANAAK